MCHFSIPRQLGMLAILGLVAPTLHAQVPVEELKLPTPPPIRVVRTVPTNVPGEGEQTRLLVITAAYQEERGTTVLVERASFTLPLPLRSMIVEPMADQKRICLEKLRQATQPLARLDALAALAPFDPEEHAEIVPALLYTIAHDKSSSVRINALRRLGRWEICQLPVIVQLEQMHSERDPQVKAEAMILLAKLQVLMGGQKSLVEEVIEVPLQRMR